MSSTMDQIPTSVLKIPQILDTLLPVLSKAIKDSLLSDCVPISLKSAAVTPLIKKPNLDKNDLKNYRPISQLPFISKVLEKIVSAQMLEYMSLNDLHEPLYSLPISLDILLKQLFWEWKTTSIMLLATRTVCFWFCLICQLPLTRLTTPSCSDVWQPTWACLAVSMSGSNRISADVPNMLWWTNQAPTLSVFLWESLRALS